MGDYNEKRKEKVEVLLNYPHFELHSDPGHWGYRRYPTFFPLPHVVTKSIHLPPYHPLYHNLYSPMILACVLLPPSLVILKPRIVL